MQGLEELTSASIRRAGDGNWFGDRPARRGANGAPSARRCDHIGGAAIINPVRRSQLPAAWLRRALTVVVGWTLLATALTGCATAGSAPAPADLMLPVAFGLKRDQAGLRDAALARATGGPTTGGGSAPNRSRPTAPRRGCRERLRSAHTGGVRRSDRSHPRADHRADVGAGRRALLGVDMIVTPATWRSSRRRGHLPCPAPCRPG